MAGGELGRRVAVAVVGIPVVLAAIWVGGWAFGALLAAAAVIATSELYGLAAAQGVRAFAAPGMAASGAMVLIATRMPTPGEAGSALFAVLVAVVLVALAASV